MASSEHYCAICDTHFGGPPNNISPKEHASIEHDGIFQGIENGSYKDWNRKEDFYTSQFNFGR